MWNGTVWIPMPIGGSNFYLDSTEIIANSSENFFATNTLVKNPIPTTEILNSIVLTNTQAFIKAYLYNSTLGLSSIPIGPWNLATHASIDDASGVGTAEIITSIKRVIPEPTYTIGVVGTGTLRTATFQQGQQFFVGQDNDPTGNIAIGGYLQTPKGIYKIDSLLNDNVCNIITPSSYVNEFNVHGAVWHPLFNLTTDNITTTSISLYQPITAKNLIALNTIDKLGVIYIAKSTYLTSKTLSYTSNGASRYSSFHNPV
jgi:hypothetical protein